MASDTCGSRLVTARPRWRPPAVVAIAGVFVSIVLWWIEPAPVAAIPAALGAGASALLWRAFRGRRADPEAEDERPRQREPEPSIEEERAASRDLLEIDRLVRRLYVALARGSGDYADLDSLLTPDARLDAKGCPWWPQDSPAQGTVAELLAKGSIPLPLRFVERSRTVHIVADIAIVISACALLGDAGQTAAVNLLRLVRSPSGWLLDHVSSRDGAFVMSEKTADPRPVSGRIAR